MHISLDAALQRQPLLSTVGDKLLPSFPGAAAAYSLRSLNGDANDVVEVRRDGDDTEKTFTAEGVSLELEDWVNGKLETVLPADDIPDPSLVTSFTATGAQNVNLNGTFTLNQFGWQKPSGDGYIRYFKSGTQWQVSDYDGEEVSNSVLSNDDVAYPWLIENWEISNPPTLGTFRTSEGVVSFGEAAAAYSLRKVRSAYAGDAVRIRRASDDVEVNVSFDANDEVSTSSAITNVTESPDQGDTTATTLGGFLTEGGNQDATVQTWYDQSGNGNDATQDTAGSQPKIAESGSYLGAVSYDGSGQQLVGSAPISVYDKSMFTVMKPANTSQFAASGSARLFNFSSDGTDNRFYFGNSGTTLTARFGNTTPHLSSHALTTDEILLSARADTSSADIFVDGNNVGSFTPTVGAVGFMTSQSIFITGSPNDTFEGTVKEVILYHSNQSDNRFKIESNINNHYGLYTASQNGFVRTWYDQSGNGNDAVQSTQNDQTKIVANGSYLGGLDFDGTDDTFSIDVGSSPSVFSMFFVAKVDSFNGGARAFQFGTGNTSNITLRTDNGSTYEIEAFIRTSGTSGRYRWDIPANTTGLFSAIFDYTTFDIDLYLDGSLLTRTDSIVPTGTWTTPTGNFLNIAGPTVFLDGEFKELTFYSSDQSANRTGIESNMADEYGITLP